MSFCLTTRYVRWDGPRILRSTSPLSLKYYYKPDLVNCILTSSSHVLFGFVLLTSCLLFLGPLSYRLSRPVGRELTICVSSWSSQSPPSTPGGPREHFEWKTKTGNVVYGDWCRGEGVKEKLSLIYTIGLNNSLRILIPIIHPVPGPPKTSSSFLPFRLSKTISWRSY